jgi:hypothetical protein
MTECRTVEDLAESIAYADAECVFLIGAGFSRSAGIPLAGELVSEIKKGFQVPIGVLQIKTITPLWSS